MEIKNRKILFLGDSITEGVGASCVENGYVSVFGKISGADVRNYGISGTRIARQKHPSSDLRWDLDFVQRVDDMDADADIVAVFGGTNDYGHGDAPLGNFESRDVYTFYGAMHILCQKLIKKYPKAIIMFITPLHRLNENAEVNEIKIRNAAPLSGYVDIIKEVARYYSLPVLDLYAVSGLQPEVDVIRELYIPDGLHPNDAGAGIIAERIMGFLKSL